MSHGNVLAPRFRNEEGACGIMVRLVCKLARRLRQSGYLAQSLRISLKDVQGGCFSAEIGLPSAQDTPTLLQQFYKLWQRRIPGGCPIKKVDVNVARLVLASQVSLPLFDGIAKLQRISHAMDKINERWGSSAVYFGPVHYYRQPMENKIAFGRIPDELD
jgi:DNA polymerase IV